MTCLKNFLHDESDREKALKRGGGVAFVNFDAMEGESRYKNEPDDLSPEKLYEKGFARTILYDAIAELESELRADTRNPRNLQFYEHLRDYICGDGQPLQRYADIAATTGTDVMYLSSKAEKFRKRLRELIRKRVGMIAVEHEVEPEIDALEDSL